MGVTYYVVAPDGSSVASYNGEHLGDDTARALANFTASAVDGAVVSQFAAAAGSWRVTATETANVWKLAS